MRINALLHSLTVAVAALGLELIPLSPTMVAAAPEQPQMAGLHVSGNQILNSSGQVVRLLGADRGAANACIQGWGIFSGPADESTVKPMGAWKMTAVRVPLNEDCWLGINGAPAEFSGSNYQKAIVDYVNLLTKYNMATILDLHWSGPDSVRAENQQPMADRDHAPAFWVSVASTFKGNTSVVFDLYNEPYPDDNQDTSAAWDCLLNGCQVGYYINSGGGNVKHAWQAAGMNELVAAVRSTGATNLVLTAGVGWAGLMTRWLQYAPLDSQNNLAASAHLYPETWCGTQACWDSVLAPIVAHYPLVVGEMGQTDCQHGFIDSLMTWLDQHGDGQSYLAWHWWPLTDVPCSSFGLITDYTSGAPSGYGAGLKTHLAAVANQQPAAPASRAPEAGPTVQPTPAPQPAPSSKPTTEGQSCSPLGAVNIAPSVDGRLVTPDGSLTLSIPAGAVPQWTTVSLALLQNLDGVPPVGTNLQIGAMSFRVSGQDLTGSALPALAIPLLINVAAPPAGLGADPPSIAVLNSATGLLEQLPVSTDTSGSAWATVSSLALIAPVCAG